MYLVHSNAPGPFLLCDPSWDSISFLFSVSHKVDIALLNQTVPFFSHMKFTVYGVGMALQNAAIQDADRDKRPQGPENHGLKHCCLFQMELGVHELNSVVRGNWFQVRRKFILRGVAVKG